MITTLEIHNFKSIKNLKLDCKRINVFIGEPNTGKSNILETLGMFSWTQWFEYSTLKQFVRYERISNLFYDENPQDPIKIKAGDFEYELGYQNARFEGKVLTKGTQVGSITGDFNALNVNHMLMGYPVKYYRFVVKETFPRQESDYLIPPSGENLMSLILVRKELRSLTNSIFSKFGFRLNLRPQENKIEILKQLEDVTVSYPYSLTSDTLQRIIFHLFAIISNQDSIIVLEEPESHSFPYYTKYFAETVALDDRKNQFFMSTHNPYLLLPLLEKAPKDDVAVFITYFQDYQTKVKTLSTSEIEEALEVDIFANLDRFLETK